MIVRVGADQSSSGALPPVSVPLREASARDNRQLVTLNKSTAQLSNTTSQPSRHRPLSSQLVTDLHNATGTGRGQSGQQVDGHGQLTIGDVFGQSDGVRHESPSSVTGR